MKTEKVYPEWVQAQRIKGTTIKKKGDSYYLYKRTSKRIPGKKYPQPVDTYIGLITPDGLVESNRKILSVNDVEVHEYGFSHAVEQLCPDDWKKPLGSKWGSVLDYIISRESSETYIKKERSIPTELDEHVQYGAQKGMLIKRMINAHGIDFDKLRPLMTVYLVYIDGKKIISKINEEQQILIDRLGIDMEVD